VSARVERLIGVATLQGLPITGYRRFGVPTAGAFDQESFLLANALVGNPAGALAMELSNATVDILFSSAARVAVVGAPTTRTNESFDVGPGEQLTLGAPKQGLRTYVAVTNGWIPDGIGSQLARSGRILTPGDVLEHGEAPAKPMAERLAETPSSLTYLPLRVLPGPQPLVNLDARTFTVSVQSDRTGTRLDGLPQHNFPELTSEPACVGAIQLTPSGQLIIIGPDGPTIGGYPKVAVLCTADLVVV
jgi:allophanate hydrolase subunit 2